MTQSLQTFRQLVLVDVRNHPGNYAPEERQLIQTNDWWLKRYLHFHTNLDKAKTVLKKAAKWRKENDIFNLKETDFPPELYRINLLTVQGVDVQGTPVMWYWGKRFYKNDSIKPHFQRYFAWKVHQLDALKGGDKPGLLVVDASDSGLSNVEFSFSFFIIELLQDFYPGCFRQVTNVNLPFILNATSKIMLSMMGEQLRKLIEFVKHAKLVEYMSEDNIPTHLGGTMHVNMTIEPPAGCVTLKELNISEDAIAKIYSTYSL